jgi:hypothetical protein
MQDAMTVYFDGEKNAGLLIAGNGTLSSFSTSSWQ